MAGAANRYARAIFEVAAKAGEIDTWAGRLQVLGAAFEVPAVRRAFENPTLHDEEVGKLIDSLDLPGLGTPGRNLVRLLVEGRRARLLPEIALEYETLADAAAGRVRASITTAVELGKSDLESLRKDLSEGLGKDVRLEARVDPEILGGLVLKVGDRLTDASVAGRLRLLRRQLVNR